MSDQGFLLSVLICGSETRTMIKRTEKKKQWNCGFGGESNMDKVDNI